MVEAYFRLENRVKELLSSAYRKYSYYYFRMVEEICRILARLYPFIIFDKIYCSAKYRRILNEKLNLKNPQTFNAKIQWLKLYDRNPKYTQLTDKYAVREYVKDRIGEQYLNELIGVYSNVDEIDFERLPNKFVLKATHGSGWNIVCDNKEKLNIQEVKARLAKWLKLNWYHKKGEWNYKNIHPRIICEKYLEGDKQVGLVDYKFFCYHGNPKFIDVHVDRFTNHMEALYDKKWILQPFHLEYPPPPNREIPQPAQLDLMVELAKKISSGIDFCRVDLYNFNNSVIFGEITFYDGSGFDLFIPREFDYILGTYLNLHMI